jgi:hypothetical protein
MVGIALLAGCASHPKLPTTDPANQPPPKKKKHEKLIVTPEAGIVGKIARVNTNARFVVINYPVGSIPGMDQHLSVYHQGTKIGDVRITGPQQDDNIVADIVTGEIQIGDEVRAN